MHNYLPKINKLSDEESLRVKLAMACLGLTGIGHMTPGLAHSKRQRMISDLRETLMNKVGPLPAVVRRNHELFDDHVKACDTVLNDIMRKSERPIHIILNLIFFCLKDMPMKDTHRVKVHGLFGLYHDAFLMTEDDSAKAIFQLIDTEVLKLVAQRMNVL